MAKLDSFEELDSSIRAVLDAETTDFCEVAEMLGLDLKQDFIEADLSGTDLTGCNLACANFAGTNLKGANLASVNLRRATLINTNLSFANLSLSISTALIRINDAAAKLETALQVFVRRAKGSRNIANISDRASELDIAVRRVHQSYSPDVRSPEFGRACAEANYCAFELAQALDSGFNRNILIRDPSGKRRGVVIIPSAHDRFLSARAKKSRIVRSTARSSPAEASVWRDLAKSQALALAETFYLRGADLTGANVEGADLTGANVEGAVMSNCHGLSPAEITDLRNRGAVFEDSPGERSEVYSPVSR